MKEKKSQLILKKYKDNKRLLRTITCQEIAKTNKMKILLEIHKIFRLNQEAIEKLDKSIISKIIESLTKISQQNKAQNQMVLLKNEIPRLNNHPSQYLPKL